MTIHKEYRTASNVKLTITVKEIRENKKPFYGTFSVMVNAVVPEKRGIAGQNYVSQGDVYSSEEEAIVSILAKSKKLLPRELQEDWQEV